MDRYPIRKLREGQSIELSGGRFTVIQVHRASVDVEVESSAKPEVERRQEHHVIKENPVHETRE